jgi:dTDP-glucose 4,6-dehydratase
MNRALVTGGAGFIGHHLVAHLIEKTDWQITVLDRLDCSGNLNRLHELNIPKGRVRFMHHDLRAEINTQLGHQIGEHEFAFHLAASTHVDRSIIDPMMFVYDNVVGTGHLLQWARDYLEGAFLYFSSDEVFGPAPDGVKFKEWDRYKSGNPYSASKAGGEELCLAFHNTYGVPVIITHCMNAFGERQHPEKFIPSTIRKIANGERVSVHYNPATGRAGSRFYIHARHIADAVVFLAERGAEGDKYNIIGDEEVDNLQLAKAVAEIIGKPLIHEMTDFATSRPGHDLRYDLDGSRLKSMGWRQPEDFMEALDHTVRWTLENKQWR